MWGGWDRPCDAHAYRNFLGERPVLFSTSSENEWMSGDKESPHPVRDHPHLCIRAILDRMLDPDHFGIKAQCLGLRGGGFPKGFRGHKERGDAATFQVCDVVHTARRTRASIG